MKKARISARFVPSIKHGAWKTHAAETKKAVSLAFDDWLVFARRGLISRVQVVMAG
jgi:hypothetical protein